MFLKNKKNKAKVVVPVSTSPSTTSGMPSLSESNVAQPSLLVSWYPVLHVVQVAGAEHVSQLGSWHTLAVQAPLWSASMFAGQHLASGTRPPYRPKPTLHTEQALGTLPKVHPLDLQLGSGEQFSARATATESSDSAARRARLAGTFGGSPYIFFV